MPVFQVSLNTRIHDKPPAWQKSFADNWLSYEISLEDLMAAIARGHALVPAAMNSEHRTSEAFLHADLAVVDIDDGMSLEDFAAHPLAAHALFTYTTSSHRDEPGAHRFRILFRLPQRISDPDLYKSLITLLIRRLGGDKSCTDPCRLFYGSSKGRQQLFSPDNALPESLIAEARRLAEQDRARFQAASKDCDAIDLMQAEYVLREVLEPTNDGERDRFIRVTAAAASAGTALYEAWSDWASRGHHGKGKNARQTSERFFQGFSGRSSLATLFFLAGEQDPEWRRSMPDALRRDGGGFNMAAGTTAAGYSMADFMGSEDDLLDSGGPSAPPPDTATQTIFNYDPTRWPGYTPPAETQAAVASPPSADPLEDGLKPDNDCDPEPTPEDLVDPFAYQDAVDPPDDAPMPRRRGRPKGSGKKQQKGDSSDPVQAIKDRVRLAYPDLRLNTMNLRLEFGPRDQPQIIDDPGHCYLMISQGAGEIIPKTHVQDAVNLTAWRNKYNPVIEYLENCRSNAEPIDYFDELATTLLGVPPEGPENPRMPDGKLYANVAIRRFLIGAVARALNPGCSHSWMPILIGDQNLGKTNFYRFLTPPDPLSGTYPWTGTIQQRLSYLSDRPHALHIGWIVLFDETERYFHRRYTEELKNLVSVSTDVSARKWENERHFHRSFVLAGATNSKTFLVDPTGNRRFMPIQVVGKVPSREDPSVLTIDMDRLKRDRDRIWAAAYQAYLDEPQNEFSSFEIAHLEEYVSNFTADSPMREAVAGALEKGCSFLFEGKKPAYTTALIFERLELGLENSSSLSKAVSDEMTRLGYINVQRRVAGKAKRFWIKADSPELVQKRKPWD